MKQRTLSAGARRSQRGVTLIVALVMLLIIGLTSAAVMRGAMSTDLVANNTRTYISAHQAAMIALRYCEDQLTVENPVVIVRAAAATEAEQAWHTFANWHGTNAIASNVPEALIQSDQGPAAPAFVPQCMAEAFEQGGTAVNIVTARGFSADYTEDSEGNAASGSVVWLQSTVQLGS